MTEVLDRAERRRQDAVYILSDLHLIESWTRYGRPVLVGAIAFNLMVEPDIDMEIYCPDLRVEHGFEVIGNCALHANVTKARFSNDLSGRDKALYWQ